MKTFYYTILLAFLGLQLSFAQVGVGTTTPDPNAALDVESTTQGVLIPRMLKAQRELIGGGSPAAGLLVYQTDQTTGFYYYDGTSWVSLSSITPSGLQAINTAAPVGIPDLPVDGSGLVKVNRTAANYGDVGYEAVDLSFSYTADNTLGATGPGSLATGVETKASGGASTALGNRTVASGQESSTAMGSKTIASGDNATAMGFETTASGFSSTSIGRGTTAESFAQTTLGSYNVPTVANDAENLDASDRVLVVGNGADENNTSDALVILKNGSITAPSLDISEITDDKALVTKEYADANTTGVEAVSAAEPPGFPAGNGLVKAGRTSSNYGNVGYEAVDLSFSNTQSTTLGATGLGSMASGFETTASGGTSVAFGTETVASGDASTAMGSQTAASGIVSSAIGSQTIASGDVSTAMGSQTAASGTGSTAMGLQTTASGDASTAMGFETLASAPFSTAMGYTTIAEAPYSTAIGILNTGGGSPLTFLDTDPLFQIGNGTDLANRSDALTVLKNGTITAPSFDIPEITDDKALITKEYADANYTDTGVAPTGLETINEGNGDGLVKVGRVSANYGNLGLGAIDLSDSGTPSTTRGATGPFSVAMGGGTTASGIVATAIGNNTTASGIVATAMGDFTIASGDYSTAMGSQTKASAFASTSMGYQTIASGDISSAMGEFTVASGVLSTANGSNTFAESFGQTSIGLYNVPTTPNSTDGFDDLDRLFVVGNGVAGVPSDALILLKNGTITAPSFDIAEITDDKALITKEYADANYTDTGVTPTGLETINEGNGDGLVKTGRIAANYGDIGESAVDLSQSNAASTVFGATGNVSFSAGFETEASGSFSFATGYDTEAFGSSSVAMGNATKALGDLSTALGSSTTASGDLSTAMGSETLASAPFSTAMGYTTIAEAPYSTAIGILNTGGGSPLTFLDTDPLFQIGNGTDLANRSDALTVLKNGTITAPSFDIAEITDDKALITKEYADANYTDAVFSGDYNDLTNLPTSFSDADNDTKIQVEESTDEDTIRFDLEGEERLVLQKSATGATSLAFPNNNSNTFLGEGAGILTTQTSNVDEGKYNVFIGNQAGNSNTTGAFNLFSGFYSGQQNTEGFANVFSGAFAGSSNTTGNNNIFLGIDTGITNTDGDFNVYLGNNAGASNSTGSRNIFLGYQSGYNETGSDKLYIDNSDTSTPLIYGEFDNDLLRINGILSVNLEGEERLVLQKSATGATSLAFPNNNSNTFLGEGAGILTTQTSNVDEGKYNVFIGNQAGNSNTTGAFNLFSGFYSGQQNTEGFANVFSGAFAGSSNTTGNNNIFLGIDTGITNTDGDFNVYLGNNAGASNSTGSRNIFLGYQSGYNETGSDKLYIDNSDTSTPLIYGEFDNDLLRINGILNVNNAFSFPSTDGTNGQVLLTDGSGTLSWTDPATFTSPAPTGLETIDEGNGDGLVRVSRDAANFGNIGLDAMDLSMSYAASTTRGATGDYSLATGRNTTASGEDATALGRATTASGDRSTAMGGNTSALGDDSTAMGESTTASGVNSTAMGLGSEAIGNNSTAIGLAAIAMAKNSLAIGSYNVANGTFNADLPNDPIFAVGNGIDNNNRSNALTVLKNGIVIAPSFSLSDIIDNKALVTKEYVDANALGSGLESIDEGNGNGFVKVGRDAANFGDIGLDAMDLSQSNAASITRGATGDYSLATGRNTTASGEDATALGRATTASGDRSTAMGGNTSALGDDSTAMGESTTASGVNSTAMGLGSEAIGNNSTAIGLGSIAMAKSSLVIGSYNLVNGTFNADLPNDPIFAVGNGSAVNARSNALTVLKNGTITAPSFDISEITDDKALITKEYADANYFDVGFSGDYNDLINQPTIVTPTGIEAVDEGNGIGFARVGRVSANYGNVGLGAVDLSDSGSPSSTKGATGAFSVAMGGGTTASGIVATAIGNNTIASGITSTAMGNFSAATGDNSTAIGDQAIASGLNSNAMGRVITAESYAQTTLGLYNVASAPSSTTGWIASDRLLVVGNGQSPLSKSDALVILKNGNATLSGNLTENSDFRLKKNIQPLENSLVKLLKLEGKNYYWNDLKPHSKDLQIGLIAQELETVFPELVHTGSDGYKSVDYTSLIPVLIEATKSQQEIIDTQNERIKALEEQNRVLLALEARLKALENDKNASHVANASK